MPPTTLIRAALAASFVLVAATVSAQEENATEPNSTACTHLFNKGTGSAQLLYCVNAHGNMMSFIGGAGAEHIRFATLIDGYTVCSAAGLHGYDAGDGGESAWGANVLLSPATSTGVAYARTTADGKVRVEHSFKMDSAEGDVSVTVKVVNASTATLTGVTYKRVSDFDAVLTSSNLWTRSLDEVEALSTTAAPKGISLNAITFNTAHDTSIGTTANVADCVMPATAANGVVADHVAYVRYMLGNLAPGKSKTVKFLYKRK